MKPKPVSPVSPVSGSPSPEVALGEVEGGPQRSLKRLVSVRWGDRGAGEGGGRGREGV